MTHPTQPPRARGTAPLDGFSSGSGPLPAPGTGEQILHRNVLESEIAHAAGVLSTMRPRARVLYRALAALEASPGELDGIFAGVIEAELAYSLEIAVQFKEDPELRRKAQILVRQFAVAEESLREAEEAHAQFVAGQLEVGLVEGFSLSKFRGSLYPLYNFAVAFAGRPILGSMFPPMRKPSLTQPLPPLPAVVPAESAGADALDRLTRVVKENPQLSALEPFLDRGVDLLKKAQEAAPGLKDRGSGLLRKAQDMAPGFLSKFGAFKRPAPGEGPEA